MTKQCIDAICMALIDEINAKVGFDFKQIGKDKSHFSYEHKNVRMTINVNVSFTSTYVDGISYDLIIDDEKFANISLSELIERLQSIKDFATDGEYFECCFCKKLFKGYGNNPQPVESHGVCCNECNERIVIPARLKEIDK